MRTKLILVLLGLNLTASLLLAQEPVAAPQQPVLVAPTAPAAADPADAKASTALLLQALEQIKSANDDMLKRQTATLLQIEEIEKAAEQIKIYARRS